MIKCPMCGVEDELENFSLYVDAWLVFESQGGNHRAVGVAAMDHCEVKHVGEDGCGELFHDRNIEDAIDEHLEPAMTVEVW